MKRIILSVSAIVTLALAATAIAGGHHRTVVRSHGSTLGPILVNRHGRTLYVFAADKPNKDRCQRISGCLAIWPALMTHGNPIAKGSVKGSLLGSIKIHGGRQVTYAGHPLYAYVGDSKPAQTSYVGINQSGGKWYAISPSGRVIKK